MRTVVLCAALAVCSLPLNAGAQSLPLTEADALARLSPVSPRVRAVIAGVDVARADIPLLAWALTLFAGITMVSSVRFYSGKDINLRKSVPFRMVVMIALSVVALMQVANNLPEVLFTVFASYAASGYVMWVWERFHKKKPVPPAG